MRLFVVLVCAHVLADFLFQPDRIAKNKQDIGILFLHASIHAFLVWILVGIPRLWQPAALIFVSHFLIDFFKQKTRDTACAFCVDQFLHLAVLAFLAFGLQQAEILERFGLFYKPLVLLSGFVATVQGSGFLVRKVSERLIRENDLKVDGLKRGGQLIGQLERALIFLLLLIGQPAGIGFLVAAKSILRFKETEEQRLAEYVLIGTLLSFGLAIGLSTLTLKAMAL